MLLILLLIYTPEMLIFLDETGLNRHNTLRKYGYSIRGKPAVFKMLLVRGECISAMAFMLVYGMLDLNVVSGKVDGDIYSDFVKKVLLSHLMPFDGKNPHSFVILDNCIVHHCLNKPCS